MSLKLVNKDMKTEELKYLSKAEGWLLSKPVKRIGNECVADRPYQGHEHTDVAATFERIRREQAKKRKA